MASKDNTSLRPLMPQKKEHRIVMATFPQEVVLTGKERRVRVQDASTCKVGNNWIPIVKIKHNGHNESILLCNRNSTDIEGLHRLVGTDVYISSFSNIRALKSFPQKVLSDIQKQFPDFSTAYIAF